MFSPKKSNQKTPVQDFSALKSRILAWLCIRTCRPRTAMADIYRSERKERKTRDTNKNLMSYKMSSQINLTKCDSRAPSGTRALQSNGAKRNWKVHPRTLENKSRVNYLRHFSERHISKNGGGKGATALRGDLDAKVGPPKKISVLVQSLGVQNFSFNITESISFGPCLTTVTVESVKVKFWDPFIQNGSIF